MREDYAVCFGELGAIDPGKWVYFVQYKVYNDFYTYFDII